MEKYPGNMKNLLSQMNASSAQIGSDIEEEVTHISAEEQNLVSAVQTPDKGIKIEVLGEEKNEDLMIQLKDAKTELTKIAVKESSLASENVELNRKLEQLKMRAKDFPLPREQIFHTEAPLNAIKATDLEGEMKAFTSEKAGEMEYPQYPHDLTVQQEGASTIATCQCGRTYKFEFIVNSSRGAP